MAAADITIDTVTNLENHQKQTMSEQTIARLNAVPIAACPEPQAKVSLEAMLDQKRADLRKTADVDAIHAFRYSVLDDQEYWAGKHKIHTILPNLFLTSTVGASQKEEMMNLGVTHILIPATLGIQNVQIRFPDTFTYKQFDLKDTEDANISQFFADTFEWIDGVLQDGSNKVLVHCARGASRSGAFVIGYVMHHCNMQYEDALEFVRGIRQYVHPNKGFESQLRRYGASMV